MGTSMRRPLAAHCWSIHVSGDAPPVGTPATGSSRTGDEREPLSATGSSHTGDAREPSSATGSSHTGDEREPEGCNGPASGAGPQSSRPNSHKRTQVGARAEDVWRRGSDAGMLKE
eukprot:366064-Chlamydomonas_euryale.AAC.11